MTKEEAVKDLWDTWATIKTDGTSMHNTLFLLICYIDQLIKRIDGKEEG